MGDLNSGLQDGSYCFLDQVYEGFGTDLRRIYVTYYGAMTCMHWQLFHFIKQSLNTEKTMYVPLFHRILF
jgi:hypothetical protein